MKKQRQDARETRQRLLRAAAHVFAEKGYRDATVAAICKQAEANVAAVNYHFGDKETLYREAWRHAFRESLSAYPPDGGVREDAPAGARLRGRIRALLARISDPKNKEFTIVHKELANPTGLLKEVIDEELRPLQAEMERIVRELLGSAPSRRAVEFCVISVISQCLNPMVAGERGRSEHQGPSLPPAIDDMGAFAEHVTRFSLAGIRAVRGGKRAAREEALKDEGFPRRSES